ncbi:MULTISPECIES: L-tyrosine/L-tryptophan isonitrile synthase family protein [Sorangium]|nr:MULTISPECIES: L-tyrosine/L-tryptophan isonitrile synthase family protein [Sorangium]
MRVASEADARMVKRASITPHFSPRSFFEANRGNPVDLQVLELLNHRAFQFNSRRRFRESPVWRERISAACKDQRPVEIVVPVFCVVANPVKRLQSTVATAAEDVSLLHLGNLANLVSEVYAPGAVFHVVTDSTFYSMPFQVTSVEAQRYVSLLRARVAALELSASVRIHDMSDVLAEHGSAFYRRFEGRRQEFLNNAFADGISLDSYEGWLSSMKASMNTRDLSLSYDKLRDTFGAEGGSLSGALDERARNALAEYRALKAAAADLQWEERAFPGAIRATIHSKNIPVLGLRIYPEYKFRSTLLPYHGIGAISSSEETGRCVLKIEPEMFLCGDPEYTRVIDSQGKTLFYHRSSDQ